MIGRCGKSEPSRLASSPNWLSGDCSVCLVQLVVEEGDVGHYTRGGLVWYGMVWYGDVCCVCVCVCVCDVTVLCVVLCCIVSPRNKAG